MRTEFKHQKGLKVTFANVTFSCRPVYFGSELARALGAGPKAVQAAEEEDERAAGRKHPQRLSSGSPPACKEL